MSNYRRLISYIYAYEGGVKGKNIGYAKVEVRNGQCRIHVNVKKIFIGSNDTGVYLLAAQGEILLGRIFIRNGSGEFRITVSAENVEGSGCSMDECYGLTVHDVESTWQSYTTIWEDAVAHAAEIELADVTAENVRRQEAGQTEQTDGPDPVSVRLPVSEEIARELEQEEKKQADAAPWESDFREIDLDGEPQREKETREMQEAQEARETQPEESAEKAEIEAADNEGTDSEKADNEKTDSEAEIPDISDKGSGSSAGNQDVPEPGNADRLRELDRLEQEELSQNNFWNKMQRRYAKVLAFDCETGCEILSIKPQDIGLLPREIWVYGNNSFLLHGYYNYRHLILARLNNPNGAPRYLLGVPGHYFSNEKYMASMFGFPHFVLARKQPAEDGRFGYWYTDIRL